MWYRVQEKLDAEMTALQDSFEAKKRRVLDESERFKKEMKKVYIDHCVFKYTCICACMVRL